MIDKNGREKYIYESNERFSIEFDVEAKKEEKDFVFGIGIFNSEGILCYGSNTHIEDFKSSHIKGKGKVTVTYDALKAQNRTLTIDL